MKDEVAEKRLLQAGLQVTYNDNSALPEFTISRGEKWEVYRLVKPATTNGNVRPGYQRPIVTKLEPREHFITDAPTATVYTLFPNANVWHFEIEEFMPGDFTKNFTSLDETLDAVMEYYFGNPTLMYPPELIAWEEEQEKQKQAREEYWSQFDRESLSIPMGMGWQFFLFKVIPLINHAPIPHRGPLTMRLITPLLRLFYWKLHHKGWLSTVQKLDGFLEACLVEISAERSKETSQGIHPATERTFRQPPQSLLVYHPARCLSLR